MTENYVFQSENNETLIKVTEDDANKWKDNPCSWTERINTVNMSIEPKVIYRFNTIPSNL